MLSILPQEVESGQKSEQGLDSRLRNYLHRSSYCFVHGMIAYSGIDGHCLFPGKVRLL